MNTGLFFPSISFVPITNDQGVHPVKEDHEHHMYEVKQEAIMLVCVHFKITWRSGWMRVMNAIVQSILSGIKAALQTQVQWSVSIHF